MPSACVVVRRLLRPEIQSPRTVDIARASAGASRDTPIHNRGLKTEEERAKVWRANRSRRLAPIRVALSSALSSKARAVRRLASSASCFCFSLASSVAAASASGAGAASLSFVLGVSSANRFEDAASRGVRSAIAACSETPSGSFSALRRWRSASVRLGCFSAFSIPLSAPLVASRSSGRPSSAKARPTDARRRTRATRRRTRKAV